METWPCTRILAVLFSKGRDAVLFSGFSTATERITAVGDVASAAGSRGRDLRPRGVYVVMRDPRPA